MSASDADSSIFLSDTDKQIKKKVGQAFSGGQDTRELHREIGGRTKVDVAFQYLTFFLEDDDELERIRVAYEQGEMESGEMKMRCTKTVQAYVAEFRERRAKVSDAVREEFMRPRQLVFKGMPAKGDRKSTLSVARAALVKHLQYIDDELANLDEGDAIADG